jgi:hypothetical protein
MKSKFARGAERQGKRFFFEQKNQETFAKLDRAARPPGAHKYRHGHQSGHPRLQADEIRKGNLQPSIAIGEKRGPISSAATTPSNPQQPEVFCRLFSKKKRLLSPI